jgi:hypothetical protein
MKAWQLALAMTAYLAVAAASVLSAQEEELAVDPLGDVALDMHIVAGKLQKLTTHEPTQEVQREVVAKLDKLIEELEKQCANCRGSMASRNPTRPALDSTIKSGPGGMGKMHAARNDGKKWGELPPHERDRILQSLNHGFPPHYQGILERYYKRLAEEKPASELSDSAGPKRSAAPRPASQNQPDSDEGAQ